MSSNLACLCLIVTCIPLCSVPSTDLVRKDWLTTAELGELKFLVGVELGELKFLVCVSLCDAKGYYFLAAQTRGERRGHSLGSAIAEVDPGFALNSVRSQSQIVDELFLSMR